MNVFVEYQGQCTTGCKFKGTTQGGNLSGDDLGRCQARKDRCWGDPGHIKHYTIPMNDIFNLNSTILPENLEVFYSTLPCQTGH